MKARHDFLDDTIGYFDQELEAYNLTMFLAIGFPILLILGSILQFIFYLMYNRKFHPFAKMVAVKIKGKNIIHLSPSFTYLTTFWFFFTVKPTEEPDIKLTRFSKIASE